MAMKYGLSLPLSHEETIREAASTSITHWKQLQKRVAWPHPEAQTGSHV
jgi:hypothetical protein